MRSKAASPKSRSCRDAALLISTTLLERAFSCRPGQGARPDRIKKDRNTRMTTVTDVMAVEKEHLLQVYRRGSVVFDRGRGCRLFDTNGRGYLDLISGVGVAALGHAHPRLAAAVADQAQRLVHTSNLFFHPLQGELATRLATLSGLPGAFFCNSGRAPGGS